MTEAGHPLEGEGLETDAGAPSSTDEPAATDESGAEGIETDASAPASTDEAAAIDGSDGSGESDGDDEGDELILAQMALAERTADLQRLQAEFLNYKRRVDRDRELIRENATFAALAPITEVLDTIDRARESATQSGGELEAGVRTIADQLERTVAARGLAKFGSPGDAFDPTIHEALSHLGEDPEVTVTTCKVIAKAGYRIGDRVVRAAQVLVADPPG